MPCSRTIEDYEHQWDKSDTGAVYTSNHIRVWVLGCTVLKFQVTHDEPYIQTQTAALSVDNEIQPTRDILAVAAPGLTIPSIRCANQLIEWKLAMDVNM